MKYNIDLIGVGIVGALLTLVPLELKDTVLNALPPAAIALPTATNALPIALVSAYSSIKVARIKAEAEKTRRPVSSPDSWLDTLLWAVLILILLVLAFLVGLLSASLIPEYGLKPTFNF
jgi:mannose/fructose/N-acetylgalactosamine-specific phosphotransferase system component IIC